MKDSSFNFDDVIAFHNTQDTIDVKNEKAPLKFGFLTLNLRVLTSILITKMWARKLKLTIFHLPFLIFERDQQEKK